MQPSMEQSKGIIAAFVNHKIAANLLMLLLLILGFWGITKLNRQLMPTIDIPVISISVIWSGASAEDVEKNILVLLEPAVRFLDNVSDMSSIAREGSGLIRLSYERNTDMKKAEADVDSAIRSVANLPDGAEDPTIKTIKFFDPVVSIGISGPVSEETLRSYALEIRDGLLDAGLDKVELSGYRDKEIDINVNESKLRQLDITFNDLANALLPNISDRPSGNLAGDYDAQIRALAPKITAQNIANFEFSANPNGEALRFSDIATIKEGFDEDDSLGFMRAQPAIKIIVSRSTSSDTIEAYEKVKRYIEQYKQTLPPSMDVIIFAAAAELVDSRLSLLIKNGLTGLALVLLILVIFLDFRFAFWIALGIPISVMATLGIMYLTGQTINMISMFALMMTLGIIVDDAIVVGEHAATRHEMGDDAKTAAIRGAGRMAAPVIAASLTTMAAFGPILVVGGVVGQIMAALPLVVMAVLISSAIECFFVLPGHLAHSMSNTRKTPNIFRANFNKGFDFFKENIIGYLADLSFRWRYATIAIAISTAILGGALVGSGKLRFEFFPTAEGDNFNVFATFQPGIPQSKMQDIIVQIEKAVSKVEADLAPEGKKLLITTFAKLDIANSGVNFDVYLVPSEERTIRTSEITSALRKAIPKVSGIERINVRDIRGGPQGRAIDVEFSGAATNILKQASEELQDILEGFDGVSAVSDSLRYGSPEITLTLNDRGTSLGFDLNNIGQQIRDIFEGKLVKTIIFEEQEIAIKINYKSNETGSKALRDLWVRAPMGGYVPLSLLVEFSERQGFARINRENAKSVVSVRADVEEGMDAGEINQLLSDSYLATISSKYGINYILAGEQAETDAAFGDIKLGVFIALGVMYIIIAWIFQSYFAPLAVMFIIPFGLVGAIWGHYILDYNLTMISLMGLLGLAGILVNDSIVLISRLQERLATGEGLRIASIGAAKDRLRAVLLTSLTTIGGLTPLLFEQSLQAQFLIPMAITIVFGLSLSTLLVLFLVPAFIGVGVDIKVIIKWLFLSSNSLSFKQLINGEQHEKSNQVIEL